MKYHLRKACSRVASIFVEDNDSVVRNGADKKAIVGFKNTLIRVSNLSTKDQRRELLPQCQAGQATQDAQWRQGRARPGRENHPGRGISEGRR